MIIIIQDNEQCLQLPPEPITHDLEDGDQVLVSEGSGKGLGSLDEVIGPRMFS